MPISAGLQTGIEESLANIKLSHVFVDGVDISRRALSLRKKLLRRHTEKSILIPILKDVSFEAVHGDRVGVIGKNGCGKSSLLKAIAGIYPVTSGTVEIDGRVTPLIEMGLGFDPEMTGRDNISLGLLHSGRITQYSQELEEQIIEFSELSEHIDLPLKNYSSGMTSRLAFSVSIFQEPEILLLDEVFAAGDAGFIEKSKNLMKERFASVSISILVNHSAKEILELCNKCYYFKDGQVAMSGSPESVVQQYEQDLK